MTKTVKVEAKDGETFLRRVRSSDKKTSDYTYPDASASAVRGSFDVPSGSSAVRRRAFFCHRAGGVDGGAPATLGLSDILHDSGSDTGL